MENRGSGSGPSISGQGIFVGTFMHSFDNKRRITIPSVWREQAGGSASFYVLPDVHEEACLCLFPAVEMLRHIERLRHHSMADRRARHFARVLGSQSELVPWDAQGRIRVKDDLLAQVGLGETAALVGVFQCIEIWNPEKLKSAGATDRTGLSDVAQYVGF